MLRCDGDSVVDFDIEWSGCIDGNAVAPTRANFVKAFADARKAKPGDVLAMDDGKKRRSKGDPRDDFVGLAS